MSRILIYIDLIPHGEYDIFQETDYSKMRMLIPTVYGGSCPNFGNRLWFQAIVSEITTEDNLIEFWDPSKTIDEINSEYDMVIAPMANVFSVGFKSLLEKLARKFEEIRIPIYVIACGVQAQSYDDLDEICCTRTCQEIWPSRNTNVCKESSKTVSGYGTLEKLYPKRGIPVFVWKQNSWKYHVNFGGNTGSDRCP